jgi:hypothetical protein
MTAAELSIRGWTLIQNFAPYNPQTIKKLNGFRTYFPRIRNSVFFEFSD